MLPRSRQDTKKAQGVENEYFLSETWCHTCTGLCLCGIKNQ